MTLLIPLLAVILLELSALVYIIRSNRRFVRRMNKPWPKAKYSKEVDRLLEVDK